MKIHQMQLASIPFEKIAHEEKNIESRLYDEKRQQINIGDRIEFTCNENPSQKVLTKVKALYHYKDFTSMFADFPPLYFGGISKEELIKEIETFYSKDEQTKYGVVGIKIELVK